MKLYNRNRLCDGGLILFLIIAAIFGKTVYSVDKATDGGKEPIVMEKVLEAAGPIKSANDVRYND